jgi:uncharacterized membrane protein YqaE (UPF0057 family)
MEKEARLPGERRGSVNSNNSMNESLLTPPLPVVQTMIGARASSESANDDLCCYPGDLPIGQSARVGWYTTRCCACINLVLWPGVGITFLSCVGHSKRGVGYGLLFGTLYLISMTALIWGTIILPFSPIDRAVGFGIFGVLLAILALINAAWTYKICSPRPVAELATFLTGTVGIKDHHSAEAYATLLVAQGIDSKAAMSEVSLEQLVQTCAWKPGHRAVLNAWHARMEEKQRSKVPQPGHLEPNMSGAGLQPVPAYPDNDEPPQVCLRFLCPLCSIFCHEGCSDSCLVAFILAVFGWIPASIYAALIWVPRGHNTSPWQDFSASGANTRSDPAHAHSDHPSNNATTLATNPWVQEQEQSVEVSTANA